MVFHIAGRTQVEGFCESGAEEAIWAGEAQGTWGLHKIAYLVS